jgi:Tfp pilus assembly protein PilO
MNSINKKTPTKNKLVYLSAIFVSIVVGVVFIAVLPTINEIKNLRKNIISKKIELEETLIKERNMSKLNEKVKIIEPKLEELNNIFINENKELEFITTLEGVAINNNVKQTINLMTESAIAENGYKKIPLNLSVTGNFINVVKYLTEIESLNYYIDIKNFNISSENKKIDGSLLSISSEVLNLNNSEVQLNISGFSFWK